MVDKKHPEISVGRQCALLGISRSAYYYKPMPVRAKDLRRMRIIDEVFTKRPFYGARRLQDELNARGDSVGRAHVSRLMRTMGIEAIYPKPRLSTKDAENRVYPYLLRDLNIVRPDQVWCVDITYIGLRYGYAYLVAVMDWFSRYVLSWELSMSMESSFCVAALNSALGLSTPKIFNSDQGSQFTSAAFTKVLLDADIRISMDGKGRAFDNIMIERLWRTVKYEEVFLRDYRNFFFARDSLGDYMDFYNDERRHSSLDKRTPSAVYWKNRTRERRAG